MRTEIVHILSQVDRLGDRRDAYRRTLRRRGLTPPLLLVLRILEGEPGLTMVELARRLTTSVPTMQSRIGRLEELGLIKRQRSLDDRRRVPTDLTRRGKAVLRQAPMAGAGRILDALEAGEVTPRGLRRLATELERLERLLFPEESGREEASRPAAVWRR
ncbi:MAG: MarR family transcriptional regulator [bacterium]